MKKNIYELIAFILALALFIAMFNLATVEAGGAQENNTTTISEAYIPSETTLLEETTTTEVATTKEVITTTVAITKRETTTVKPKETSTSAKATTTKPTTENHPVTEKTTSKPTTSSVNSGKYPVATEIWNYMKNLGWSDAVCAGILGNMMAEVGGQTLDLSNWQKHSQGGYYGICQWSKTYYPGVVGRDIQGQCDFLRDTIKQTLNTYGSRYASGMNYNKFLQMTDPREVALCFAKCYERCASAYYSVRQSNATKAYQYFVG